jgi:hypothetical protein
MKHIEFTKLIEKYEESLSSTDEKEISEHLSGCGECTIVSKKLGTFFDFAQSYRTEEIPQFLTANLLNIYQPSKLAPKKESFVKRFLGKLVFDDWQTALNERLFFSDTRQLLYKVNDFDIDLRLQFINGKCLVSGQIFPDIEKNATVKIVSGNSQTEANLTENREFTFSPIAEGTYDLEITFDNIQIEIPKLSLLR